MKKIKAVLCDYDGTLIDGEGQYLPEVKPLIKKIQDKGIRFSLATGRAYYSPVKVIEKELGIQGTHILNGGAMIFDSINNKILLFQAISKESTGKIVKYLSSQKIIFSLEAKDHVYVSNKVKGSRHYPHVTNRALKEFKKDEQILKMVTYARYNKLNESQMNFHIKNIQKICHDISMNKFESGNFFGVDITSEKATKHTAVLEYLKILNISSDEVVAIGDGPNDYPLFTACGFGIAMVTAPKELKEIAGLIVPSVKDGGMIEALKYIYNNLI